MSSRLQRIREIYEHVADLEGDVRDERLTELCEGDAELRMEIKELLAQDPNTILERIDSLTGKSRRFDHPSRIGSYSILEVLGRGGMGIVYRARQEEPLQREVALKLLHQRASRELIARFRGERQLLARMDHANIAKVFDAGSTDDGELFFVMELIEGRPIDVFCDESGLSNRDRVGLLVEACRGVQHAHQKGIIHRDLKPSNLLVTEGKAGPRLRVIDFGIARVEEELERAHTILTQQGQILGTPEYMSPEQAEGDMKNVDVRSDVYSLGVILHRLLSTQPPYDLDGTTVTERARIIATTPAAAMIPREGARPIDPDLQLIVYKALEKDPDLRYQSASELRADLQRFLDGLPITARPASTIYHLRKLVQRYRVAAILSAFMLVALISFGVGMTFLAESQRRALRTAETERTKSDAIRAFLEEMLASADPAENSKDVTVLEVLDVAASRISEDLETQPEIRAALHHTLGSTYMELGTLDKAEQELRISLELRADLDQKRTLDYAQNLDDLAEVQWHKLRFQKVPPLLQQALEIRLELLPETSREVAQSFHNLGSTMMEMMRLDEADSLNRRALEIRRELYGEEHEEVASSLNNLGIILSRKGRYEESVAMGREAADMRRRLLGLEHPDTYHSISNLAVAIRNGGGEIEEAKDLLLEVLASQRVHLGEDHPDVAMIHYNLGSVYVIQDSLDLAERHYSRSFDIRLASLGPAHPRTGYSLKQMAELLEQAGRFDDVAHLHERYLDTVVDALEVRPNDLFRSEIYLARYRLNRGQLDLSAAHIEHCVEMARAGRLGVDQMQRTLTVAEKLMASGGVPPVVEALRNELERLMEKDSSEAEG